MSGNASSPGFLKTRKGVFTIVTVILVILVLLRFGVIQRIVGMRGNTQTNTQQNVGQGGQQQGGQSSGLLNAIGGQALSNMVSAGNGAPVGPFNINVGPGDRGGQYQYLGGGIPYPEGYTGGIVEINGQMYGPYDGFDGLARYDFAGFGSGEQAIPINPTLIQSVGNDPNRGHVVIAGQYDEALPGHFQQTLEQARARASGNLMIQQITDIVAGPATATGHATSHGMSPAAIQLAERLDAARNGGDTSVYIELWGTIEHTWDMVVAALNAANGQ